jgi:ribonuclease BN (tRNA processing enzyme)
VRKVLLFHHDPNHDDGELEAIRDRVRALWGGGEVELAREGDEFEL